MSLLRHRHLLTGALVVATGAAAGLVWAAQGAGRDAELLRSDPDAISASPALLRRAEALARPAYASHCAACHGADMKGDPDRGAPDLVDADWLYGVGRVTEIEQTVLYGVRSGSARAHAQAVMPAYARPAAAGAGGARPAPLTPPQLEDVVQHMLHLEGRPAEAAASLRGRAVFEGAGGCYDCHGRDGGGDPAIGVPNLTDRVQLYGRGSAGDVRRIIEDGRAGVCPAWSRRLPPATVRALAVHIAAAAARGAKGRS